MFERLHQQISGLVSLTEEEFTYFKTLFLPKKLRRRHYLLQEGDVCIYQAFVAKGILRSYITDEKGSGHILQFATEGWWIADLSSFLTGEPSRFNIDAIEEAALLLMDKPSWEKALQQIPKLEQYFRLLVQNHLIATQKRLLQSFTESAEERYLKFEQTYPSCVPRIPKHMIASYLGISRETLSRLSKQRAVRQ